MSDHDRHQECARKWVEEVVEIELREDLTEGDAETLTRLTTALLDAKDRDALALAAAWEARAEGLERVIEGVARQADRTMEELGGDEVPEVYDSLGSIMNTCNLVLAKGSTNSSPRPDPSRILKVARAGAVAAQALTDMEESGHPGDAAAFQDALNRYDRGTENLKYGLADLSPAERALLVGEGDNEEESHE